MILKIRNDYGWVYHEVVKVVTDDSQREDVGTDKTVSYTGSVENGSGDKMLIFEGKDNKSTTVYYNECYLLNDNGDTINKL